MMAIACEPDFLPTPYGQFYVAPWPAAVWSLPERELSLAAKAAWSLLASYAGPDGRCFPSHDRLAGDLGLTRRKVQIALYELEEIGLLGVVERPGRSHAYVFPRHRLIEESLRGGVMPVSREEGRSEGESTGAESFPQPARPGRAGVARKTGVPARPGGARSRSSRLVRGPKRNRRAREADQDDRQQRLEFEQDMHRPVVAEMPGAMAETPRTDRPTDRPTSRPAPREAAAAPIAAQAKPGGEDAPAEPEARPPRFVPCRADVEQLAAFMAKHTRIYDLKFAYRVFENARKLRTLGELIERCRDRIKRGFRPDGNGWFLAVAIEKFGYPGANCRQGPLSAAEILFAGRAKNQALEYEEFQRRFEAQIARRGP